MRGSLSLNLRRAGQRTYIRFKRRAFRGESATYTQLKLGQPLIIIGGVHTGKTKKLETFKNHLEFHKQHVILLDAMMTIGDMVSGCEGKNIAARQAAFLDSVTSESYVLIDNAEKVTDSKKLILILWLLEKCKNMVVTCHSLNQLNWKLRRRMEVKGAIIEHLGYGGHTIDVTLMFIGVFIVFIAVSGAMHLLFGAAALRYLFQGVRASNRKSI